MQYMLVIVTNAIKSYKDVQKKLKEIGEEEYNIYDSLGSTEIVSHLEFGSMLSNPMTGTYQNPYNKTLFLLTKDEEHALSIMDHLEEILSFKHKDYKQGIMFTIPIIMRTL